MECQENGRTMWWKPKGLPKVTIVGLKWKKLEWSMFNASDSTRRKGEKNMRGSSPSFSPHIVCCLQNLVQRNLNKGVKGGRFNHFFLQLSLSLGSDFFASHPQHVFLPSLQESPWKKAWYFPARESLGWGWCLSNSWNTNHTTENGEHANPWVGPFKA